MEIDSNKVRSVVNQDRLSALPDELIHQILSCFDTKFAVQTSMLSSRWKLIWKSVPCLDFASREFNTLHKFSKFVTHVLSHRNHQVEVVSVKLRFFGAASQVFVRKIASYAFSHNVQELTVTSWPKRNHEFPPCLFSSQTLKQLSLCFDTHAPRVTPKTPWNFPALTNLHLFEAKLCDDYSEYVDLFSKCVNLKNLVIERSEIWAKVFDIITPRLSKLMLVHIRHSGVINVIAPQVENLTVISCSINNIKAPLRLSYLCYQGYHPKWFKNCFHSLNEVSVSLPIYVKNQPYKETAARETISMLQELRSARCLTFNMDIVECISSFPDLLSHLPSPFSNLISLNIISYMRDDAYKVKLPTEARNFLLEDSPSATFIMDLPEPPPTKAMKAKAVREKNAKLVTEIEFHMKELQAMVEHGNMILVETEKTLINLENLLTEVQVWTKMTQSEEKLSVGRRLAVQRMSCLKELDVIQQGFDDIIAIVLKKQQVRSLIENLPKRQMAVIESRYSRQLEEPETLSAGLRSRSEEICKFVEKITDNSEKNSTDKTLTFHDASSSKLIEASEPSSFAATNKTSSSSSTNPMP
ncbi:F-box domain, cyclin-like protein [Tanacetum coccineum]